MTDNEKSARAIYNALRAAKAPPNKLVQAVWNAAKIQTVPAANANDRPMMEVAAAYEQAKVGSKLMTETRRTALIAYMHSPEFADASRLASGDDSCKALLETALQVMSQHGVWETIGLVLEVGRLVGDEIGDPLLSPGGSRH
jgi:hypothetical protein